MLKPNNAVTTNLLRARELIADEKNWCQGYGSVGKRRCAVVAVYAMQTDPNSCQDAWWILNASATRLFGKTTINVNDTLGHAAVMRVYDEAIEMSLREGL